jgi:hypothetical protein
MSTRTGRRMAPIAVLVVMAAFGCSSDDDGELPFAPEGCLDTKPATGHLHVQITLNAQNPRVPINVYEGPIESGRLVRSDSLGVSQFSYELPADHSYAVTARYLVGQDTVLAIGSDDIRTSQTQYYDAYCWEVGDGKVDVRLKL